MCGLIPQDDINTCSDFFDVKFSTKAEGAITDSRERTADALYTDLESVALVIEGPNSDVTQDDIVPTAKCIHQTKKRPLVTRSGLRRLRCCACHFFHKQAMIAFATVRKFFQSALHVHHFNVDAIAGDGNAAAYRNYKRQENQDLYNSSVAFMLRERCNVRSIWDVHLKADFILIIISIILPSFVQQEISIVAS